MNREQLKKLEKDLWAAADKLRANSDLKASEYSTPVLGIIFLKFADNKYRQHEDAIYEEYTRLKGTRMERSLQDIAIEKCGFALAPHARYDHLLSLPDQEDIAKASRMAISSITLAELMHGAEKSSHVSQNLAAIEDFCSRLEVLPYGAKAAQHYGAIRPALEKVEQSIGVNDLHIAGHARSEGLVLVTNNLSEFMRVPALEVENWVHTSQ